MPRTQNTSVKDHQHGTKTGYIYGCRCVFCRDAQAVKQKERNDAARLVIREAKDVPCFDCNGRFPIVCMDFDHRDPNTKKFQISTSLSRSVESLKAEIAKCDVVCSNCHRIRTAAQRENGAVTVGRPRKS